MIGIGLEIATSGLIAGIDIWEASNNNPLNKPISDISAFVLFRVNKADFSELPIFGNPRRAADLELMEPPSLVKKFWMPGLVVSNEKFWYLDGISEFPDLATDHMDNFIRSPRSPSEKRTYFAKFRIDDISADWGELYLLERGNFVRDINRVNVLTISVKCLPHDIKILDGSVRLVINNGASVKMFQIPPQEDNRAGEKFPDTYSNTTPFVILAYLTNSPSH